MMMPMVPTSLITMPTKKPKIGFSIDSIVGSSGSGAGVFFAGNNDTVTGVGVEVISVGTNLSTNKMLSQNIFSSNSGSNSECSERQLSPFSDCSSYPTTELTIQIRNHLSDSPPPTLSSSSSSLLCVNRLTPPAPVPPLPPVPSVSVTSSANNLKNNNLSQRNHIRRYSNNSTQSDIDNLIINNEQRESQSHLFSIPPIKITTSPLSPSNGTKYSNQQNTSLQYQQQQQQQQQQMSPSEEIRIISRSPTPLLESPPLTKQQNEIPLINGIANNSNIIRPFPVGPTSLNDLKSLPSYMNASTVAAVAAADMASSVTGHSNPHFLAAQFQMAAAIAHGQATAASQTLSSPTSNCGVAGVFGNGHGSHQVLYPNSNHMIRDGGYPLYPWLLSRHGRIFPNRFPGNFLLQPFRKPKRIRTAFSPSQLLKLEHAFESNHYVVGAERKTLAQALSLSETQVKVWFQNRRTKHKRMQQEDDSKGGNSGNKLNVTLSPDRNNENYDSDELIDMDDCPSDDECD